MEYVVRLEMLPMLLMKKNWDSERDKHTVWYILGWGKSNFGFFHGFSNGKKENYFFPTQ